MSHRAAIYTRVSSNAQEEDGSSLDTQRERCTAYAAERGYTVVRVVSDTHTGSQYRERPGLSELRGWVRSGMVDIVICYAIDRLSRNQAHTYIIAEECADHRVRLEFVTEDFEDSAVGRFIRSARAFAAEVEREKIGERTVRGKIARLQSGRLLPGRHAPYGYRWRDAAHTALDPDPVTAPVVQRIFREAVAGVTLRQIAIGLMRDGIPAPEGGTVWRFSTLGRILARRAYTGEAVAWAYLDDAKRIRPDVGIPLPEGVVPRLIDDTSYALARERQARNKAQAARNNRGPTATLLRCGIARCGICGRAMTVRRRRGKEAPAFDYRCVQGGTPGDSFGCGSHGMAARTLDAAVWAHVARVLREPELWLRGREWLPEDDPSAGELARLEAADAALETRQHNLARAVAALDDDAAAAPLLAALRTIAGQRQQLAGERARVQEAGRGWSIAHARRDELAAWCRTIDVDALTYDERRRVLDMLGVTVLVYPKAHRPRWLIQSRPQTDAIVSRASGSTGHNRPLMGVWTDADVKEAAD